MPPSFDTNAAERFASLALACVHKEYPNKISHNLNSERMPTNRAGKFR
jgi:hypothetical protein